MTGQDPTAATRNEAFFADNAAYTERVASLDTYRFIRERLDAEVAGAQRLLDIGNGGTFDYDPALAGAITAVDLFAEPGAERPPNVEYVQGDALDLPVEPGGYDTALMVMLFHHLVGASARDLPANVRASLAQAHRALAPGGRLIVVESCVAPWFYAFERVAFGALLALSRRGAIEHPATLQLPPRVIAGLIEERFGSVEMQRIPVGTLILQFGHRWPTALTPARPWIFTARR
jgi:SAM-dependent methyltransferase